MVRRNDALYHASFHLDHLYYVFICSTYLENVYIHTRNILPDKNKKEQTNVFDLHLSDGSVLLLNTIDGRTELCGFGKKKNHTSRNRCVTIASDHSLRATCGPLPRHTCAVDASIYRELVSPSKIAGECRNVRSRHRKRVPGVH